MRGRHQTPQPSTTSSQLNSLFSRLHQPQTPRTVLPILPPPGSPPFLTKPPGFLLFPPQLPGLHSTHLLSSPRHPPLRNRPPAPPLQEAPSPKLTPPDPLLLASTRNASPKRKPRFLKPLKNMSMSPPLPSSFSYSSFSSPSPSPPHSPSTFPNPFPPLPSPAPSLHPPQRLITPRKHLLDHDPRITCLAGTGCTHRTRRNKDMHRHLWSKHRVFAEANGVPRESKKCPMCRRIQRQDNLKRHVKICSGGQGRTGA